tara:strand:+ start:344 stop:739 length:396 start_codon:yes stop_codon:yes gene_type:complete
MKLIYKDHKGRPCIEKYYLYHLDSFISMCQFIVDKKMKTLSWDSKLSIRKGRRYDKILSKDVGNPSNSPHNNSNEKVWGFVDKTNGDILKPASWNAPAKHARGNIYEEDCMQFIGPYGPAYMDTIKEYYGA